MIQKHTRLGSCGCLLDHPVGTIVVPKACVAVSRNYDYDFGIGNSPEPPYRISKPVSLTAYPGPATNSM